MLLVYEVMGIVTKSFVTWDILHYTQVAYPQCYGWNNLCPSQGISLQNITGRTWGGVTLPPV